MALDIASALFGARRNGGYVRLDGDEDVRTGIAAKDQDETAKDQDEARRHHDDALHIAQLARAALTLVDAIDGEAKSTVMNAIKKGEEVEAMSRDMIAAIEAAVDRSNEVVAAAAATSHAVQGVASATEEMTATGHQIAGLVERAETIVGSAVSSAERAGEVIRHLAESTQAIESIAQLIDKIAKQTNLLALNATIEANRAGTAGRGFAVVAEEVKVLAQQTASATKDIRRQIEDIRGNTEQVVEVIAGITATIREVNEISGEIGNAVQQQAQANGEISSNAQQTAMDTAHVSENMTVIAGETRTTYELSEKVRANIGGIVEALAVMQRRMSVVINQFAAMGSKKATAIALDLPVALAGPQGETACTLLELSPAGAEVTWDGDKAPDIRGLMLSLPWLGKIAVTSAVRFPGKLSLHFASLDDAVGGRVVRLLSRFEVFDLPILALCKATRDKITETFESALASRTISEDDLFDDQYQPVAGTNPQQVVTRFTEFTDRMLPDIQEPVAASLPGKILAVCAVDRNGYLPTHMKAVSKPQGSDPAWNNANCRNHRLFNDRVGLSAGQNQEEYLLQTYMRETGVDTMEILKDLSMPIFIKGRHWGGLRVTYRF